MKKNRGGKGIGFWLSLLGASVIALAAGFFIWVAASPTRAVEPATTYRAPTAGTISIAWPKDGAAALGTTELGLKATHGSDQPLPTASMAKIITVLVVLDKYPLAPGETGPTLTMTEDDVKEWASVVAQDGSNIRVTVGEKLTEKQMVQGILLESANNLADTLAEWAFGSLANYKIAATKWLARHNLHDTTIGPDASGFDPGTKSTPGDLFELSVLALKNPVVAEIVKTKSMNFPVVGKIDNTNKLLARDATVIGIKTGSTDQAGYCLMFAATRPVGTHGQMATVVGVITGQKTGADRFANAEKLINSAFKNLGEWQIASKGQVVGNYTADWGASSPAITNSTLRAIGWRDAPPVPKINLSPIKTPAKSGQVVGTMRAGDNLVNAVLANDMPAPTFPQKLQMTFRGQK